MEARKAPCCIDRAYVRDRLWGPPHSGVAPRDDLRQAHVVALPRRRVRHEPVRPPDRHGRLQMREPRHQHVHFRLRQDRELSCRKQCQAPFASSTRRCERRRTSARLVATAMSSCRVARKIRSRLAKYSRVSVATCERATRRQSVTGVAEVVIPSPAVAASTCVPHRRTRTART